MLKIRLTIILFIIFSNYSLSQIYNFRSIASSTSNFENNEWKEWSEWAKTDVLIQNIKKDNTLILNTKQKQTFKLIDFYGTKKDEFGIDTTSWMYVNQDGEKCYVELVVQDLKIYYNFYYKKIRIFYEVKMLDW